MSFRALRWYAARDLRLEQVATPELKPGQARIKVERVGLCGTDIEEYLHGPLDIPMALPHPMSGRSAPLVPGHEVVGVVIECPDDPAWVGRRVIPDVVNGCGRCWWCLRHEEGLCPDLVVLGMHDDGGLAEQMVCRSDTLVSVPEGVPVDVAVFAEPTSVAVRAVAKAGDLRGATVAVVGAGVIGNLVAQVALAAGAQVVVQDPHKIRRQRAPWPSVGAAADRAAAARLILDVHGGRLADVVFECAGRPQALHDAIALARRGGTVVLMGLCAEEPSIPWREVVLGEKRLVGSAAHIWDVDVASAVRLLATGTVDPRPLVSQVVGLEEVSAVLEELARPNELAKVLVDPGRTEAARVDGR